MKLKDTFMSSAICVKIVKYLCISKNFNLLCRQFFPFITLKQTSFSANYSLRTIFFMEKIGKKRKLKKLWSIPKLVQPISHPKFCSLPETNF